MNKFIKTASDAVFKFWNIFLSLNLSLNSCKIYSYWVEFVNRHEDTTNEYGQDIRLMKLELTTENYLYFVPQVKTWTIGSSSKQPNKEIEDFLSEIRPEFNKYIFEEGPTGDTDYLGEWEKWYLTLFYYNTIEIKKW